MATCGWATPDSGSGESLLLACDFLSRQRIGYVVVCVRVDVAVSRIDDNVLEPSLHAPYRRMLILTGVMLGAVLLVMVGEEAQEMQLAHWIPTTALPRLAVLIPPWMGLWFSVFHTVETLVSQAVAALLVVGSYFVARVQRRFIAEVSRGV